MLSSQVLLFSASIPNSRRALEPSNAELSQLSERANVAVQELGPGWNITSATTNMTHFEMGNLPAIGLVLTVVATKE